MGKLNIWLHDNHLTEDPNDYFGKVKSAGTIDMKKLVSLIIEEGIELQEETILDVLSRSERIKANCLTQGYSINLPFCRAMPKISGTFTATEIYSKEKHRVSVSFRVGASLRAAMAETDVDILGTATVEPIIGKVIDSLSGAEDSIITPNNVLKIMGSRIKVIGEGANVGVWLVNQTDQSRTQCAQLISNNPKDVWVMLPALPQGDYILEVITQYSQGGELKTPRTAAFEHVLTVE